MHEIQKHHIVDIYTFMDIFLSLPDCFGGGHPSILRESELLTIIIRDGLNESWRNLIVVYDWVKWDYTDYFPQLSRYQKSVEHCHHLLLTTVWSWARFSQIRLLCASPKVPRCQPANLYGLAWYKVAEGVSRFGKNWQGWHYDFKLHTAIGHYNRLVPLVCLPLTVGITTSIWRSSPVIVRRY